jgi:hypothetical protein
MTTRTPGGSSRQPVARDLRLTRAGQSGAQKQVSCMSLASGSLARASGGFACCLPAGAT